MSDAAAAEELFFAALEKTTASARATFLDSACGGDAELRRQVEKLLNAHPRVGDFLDRPAVEQARETPEPTGSTRSYAAQPPAPPGLNPARSGDQGAGGGYGHLAFLQPSTRPDALGRLGHYEVLEVLGRGG